MIKALTTIVLLLATLSVSAQTEHVICSTVTNATGELVAGVRMRIHGDHLIETCAREFIDANGEWGKALVDGMIDIDPVNQFGQEVLYAPTRELFDGLTVTRNELITAGQMCSPQIDYAASQGEDRATVIKLAFIIRAGVLLGNSGADLQAWIANSQVVLAGGE